MTDTESNVENGSGGIHGAGDSQTPEDKMIGTAEETMKELQDAMSTMMGSGGKMMQAFIDMRLSYLKVMRAGLEDPATAVEIVTKNLKDMANTTANNNRAAK